MACAPHMAHGLGPIWCILVWLHGTPTTVMLPHFRVRLAQMVPERKPTDVLELGKRGMTYLGSWAATVSISLLSLLLSFSCYPGTITIMSRPLS